MKKTMIAIMIFFLSPCFVVAEDAGMSGSDVYGSNGGYIHPFLSVAETYDDNIFNENDYPKSDSYTLLSPGIWLASPATRKRILNINTSNVAPSGLQIARDKPAIFRRFQAYALYQGDFEYYQRYSDEDRENHRAEAFLQFNLRGGFSFDLLDQYKKAYDPRGTGISTQLDQYEANLASVLLASKTGEKISLRFDYSNYDLNYIDTVNNARDRSDNSYSLYVYYNITPKFSIFTQYEFIDIDYELSTISSSEEQQIYGGIKWNITAKSKGNIKFGYVDKDFELTTINKHSDFIFEIVVDHYFTPKTSLKFIGLRKTNETTIATTEYILAHKASMVYEQDFTPKTFGSFTLSYSQDKYIGPITVGFETKERQDNIYTVSPAFKYVFLKWLSADITYAYTKRDSSFDTFDYEDNVAMLRFTASL